MAQTPDRIASARQLWTDGQEAFRQRDYARAAELMQELLELDADGAGIDGAAVRMQLGITLLRLNRTDQGVSELQASVALNPQVGRAHHKLGLGLARLGRSDDALDSFQRAVALEPETPDHQWRLGEELRRRGRRREALAAIQKSLQLKPAHPEALASLAKLQGGWLSRLARRLNLG